MIDQNICYSVIFSFTSVVDQFMQMEVYAWIFCKTSGVQYMMQLPYLHLFRYTKIDCGLCDAINVIVYLDDKKYDVINYVVICYKIKSLVEWIQSGSHIFLGNIQVYPIKINLFCFIFLKVLMKISPIHSIDFRMMFVNVSMRLVSLFYTPYVLLAFHKSQQQK